LKIVVYNSRKKEEFSMAKREVMEVLGGLQPGDVIFIGGQAYPITEVIEYKLGDFNWRNMVSRDETGKEIVFEVVEGKVRRWDQVEVLGATVDAKALEYDGENYEQDETGTARFVSHTQEGTERGRVAYSVLEADSGNRLSVEERDGEITVYFSSPDSDITAYFSK
jgi:hypothetical protein